MEKSLWQSRTIWANLIGLAAALAPVFADIEIDAETQTALTTSILAIINIVLRLGTDTGIKGMRRR